MFSGNSRTIGEGSYTICGRIRHIRSISLNRNNVMNGERVENKIQNNTAITRISRDQNTTGKL